MKAHLAQVADHPFVKAYTHHLWFVVGLPLVILEQLLQYAVILVFALFDEDSEEIDWRLVTLVGIAYLRELTDLGGMLTQRWRHSLKNTRSAQTFREAHREDNGDKPGREPAARSGQGAESPHEPPYKDRYKDHPLHLLKLKKFRKQIETPKSTYFSIWNLIDWLSLTIVILVACRFEGAKGPKIYGVTMLAVTTRAIVLLRGVPVVGSLLGILITMAVESVSFLLILFHFVAL